MNLLRCICVVTVVAALGMPVRAEEKLSPEIKKALEETEAKIRALKAAGQLPDSPEPSPKSVKAPPAGCTRLAVGGAAVVNYGMADSPTAVPAMYGLSRTTEKSFLVEVRAKYSKGKGYPEASATDAQVNEKYKKLVSTCLKDYEGKLKNEKTGQEVVLRLTENTSVPEIPIEILANGIRSNALGYEADISCPVVLHEMLHLLGLPDEYPDQPGLNEPHMDCRPFGPVNSIMRDHNQAEKALAPRPVYEVAMCECEVKGTACWELSAKSNGKECPKGAKLVYQKFDASMRTSLNALNTGERFVLDLAKMREAGFEAPKKQSIMFPAHFRAITEPGCRDVNDNYYQCSQNAYRFSKPTAGVDLGDPSLGCKPTPAACRFRSMKWLE